MVKVKIDYKYQGNNSGVVYAPFDKAKDTLEKNGYEIISLPRNAQLRIQNGKDSKFSKRPNLVREGIIYIPKDIPKLVRNSPILTFAEQATQTNREDGEFYIEGEQLEKAVSDSVNWPTRNRDIPTNRFIENELTVFAFGGEKKARAYGDFLKEIGINRMPVWVVDQNYVNSHERPFVRQLLFESKDLMSALIGNFKLRSSGNFVRGETRSYESVLSELRKIKEKLL
jgi:hypothetical protein